MAKVELIDHTGRGFNDPWYAASLMIWTKRTRVEMSPGGLEEIRSWSQERKIEELRYMAATVPSSWEFCDFTFFISGVTRAFTHQLVRTRTLSYAQQAMQVLRVDRGNGWDYHVGKTIAGKPDAEEVYRRTMNQIAGAYTTLADTPGVHTEDARGVLPTNILTNIVVKGNLRVLCDMLRKRASPRNQGARPGSEGEWSSVHRQMKERMVEALPWTDLFLNRVADNVAKDLYEMLEDVEDKLLKTNLTKAVDQLMTNIGEVDENPRN
jgi:flavin-dependent thymidylate synthase